MGSVGDGRMEVVGVVLRLRICRRAPTQEDLRRQGTRVYAGGRLSGGPGFGAVAPLGLWNPACPLVQGSRPSL